MNDPASVYRQFSVEGANPIGLIVMLYDRAIADLHKAMSAIERGDVELRTKHLKHFCSVLNQLEGSLDFERGGEVARNLARSYRYARTRSLAAAITNSKEILAELSGHFTTLREAWREAEPLVAAWQASAGEKAGSAADDPDSGEFSSPQWQA